MNFDATHTFLLVTGETDHTRQEIGKEQSEEVRYSRTSLSFSFFSGLSSAIHENEKLKKHQHP